MWRCSACRKSSSLGSEVAEVAEITEVAVSRSDERGETVPLVERQPQRHEQNNEPRGQRSRVQHAGVKGHECNMQGYAEGHKNSSLTTPHTHAHACSHSE